MAVRSLTEVFILMRNNALQSRHIFSEQAMDDRAALVSPRDVEKGMVNNRDTRFPPAWVDGVEEVHYEMTKIRQKMKELSSLHEKHLTRPTLDESAQEEKEIEHLTQDLTRMFNHCQRLIHQIRTRSQTNHVQEARVNNNVVTSLVSSLRELSSSLRQSQSAYLRKLKMREERSQQFFDTPLMSGDASSPQEDVQLNQLYDQKFTEEQLLIVADNTRAVEIKEREITSVVRSIAELNEIFKDLAQVISDQGTVLDRIDYNLENVQTSVQQGYRQLQKAENYQKKNHKMMCVLVLSGTVILLLILLIVFKT